MLSVEKTNYLKQKAIEIRENCLEQFVAAGRGHVGGSLSICELMACLYFHVMRVDPEQPRWKDRDRLILSKGHAGPAMYAALALRGFFPQEELLTLNQPGTRLPSHTDMNRTPGVDMSTGSLGQGFSSGCGIALANKLAGRSCHTYIVLGDGECQEGQVWEAAMFAPGKGLDRVIVFVDNNGKQLDGTVEQVIGLRDIKTKFASFGWNVIEVGNGHDVAAICSAVEEAKGVKGKPSVILLKTIKGKGWRFAEQEPANHVLAVDEQAARSAKEDMARQLAALHGLMRKED